MVTSSVRPSEKLMRLVPPRMASSRSMSSRARTSEPRPIFKRKRDFLQMDLPVSLPDAVLGGKVAAPTPDGPVSLKVPKGSNTGAVLRLKGRGLTDHKTGKRGDLLARLVVTLPEGHDPKLDAFAEEMRRERPYSPRRRV